MSQFTKPTLPNNRYKTILLTLTATLIIATSNLVHANSIMQGKEPRPRPCFSSIDINNDSEISFGEFSSHKLPHGEYKIVFKLIDTDQNGVISHDEFVSHKPPKHKQRREERS